MIGETTPAFTDGNAATRTVAENSPSGMSVGAPVTATDPDNDTLSYGLGGADASSFEIDDNGQITVGAGTVLDHEAGRSYTVTVTATDSHDATATIEVTVTVTDVDEPPGRPAVSISGQTLTSLTVEWDAPDNSGRPAITDYDVGYRKVTDPVSPWSDAEHEGTGLSAVIGDLAPGTDYQVRVMARNDEGDGQWSDTAQGTTVANSAPDFGANTASRSVPENSPSGTSVGAPVTATDADNDTLTYRITGPNTGGFTIDATTGQLRSGPAENYDFEDSTKNSYTVTVTATDPHGGSGSVEVTIAVTDVNEPPAFAESSPTRQLAENAGNAALDGPLTATDPDAGDTLTYSITGPNTGGFTIDATTGQLRSGPAENYDFEDPTKNSYTVTVTATDSHGGSASVEVTIAVTDVNEAPVFAESNPTRQLAENTDNAPLGSPLTATDPDAGDTLTYSITGPNPGGFTVDEQSGQLSSGPAESYDFEDSTKSSYTVTVTATDPHGGSATIGVTVTVIDVDEPPGRPTVSISGQTLSSLSVEWDAPDNEGRPAITDYDVEYRRASDSGWTDHPHQGTGLSAVIGDLTPGTDYRVQVMARNEEGDGQWSETAQGTTVANSAPEFGANTASRSVAENSVQGTNVGAPVTATDPDNDALSYGLGGADASSFQIDDSGQITVGAGTVLDHEARQSYAVTVTATDSHDATATIAVTVTVSDVNEPPGRPAVSISGRTLSSLSVEWDAPENSGRPAITDYDVGYRKVADPVSSWSDDAEHEGAGLSITLSDLAPGTDYEVRVMARNEEGDGQWSETAQGTTVANSDPIVAGDENTTTRSLPENSPSGTSVGDPLTATDPDNDTLSYGITGPNTGGFTIDATTGQLRSGPAESYDFEDPTKNSYTVTVTATDGHGGSASVGVTVTVTDVNEPPGRPAVSISGQTLSSLSVEWDAPENSGRPAITDYDVGYRRASDSGWTDHPHQGTGLSAVIGDLAPGTDYRVQVMARNEEGDGQWSETAQGTTVANSDPIVAGDENTTTRSLPENSPSGTSVGDPLTATDPDNDTLSYGITGPNTGGFTINATIGQLRSGPAENYDFEDPTKNSYTVTVTATDGHGGSASVEVTVTVRDVDEPPGRPVVSISGRTLTSLSVEWDAPENAGRPAITDYDVEYRRASDSGWTDHPHQGTGLSAVIGDLAPGTDYQVRVMARNEEGDGQWSDTAQGTTVANSAPVFGANTASRSVPENSAQGTSVGDPLTATDPDAGDTLSYSLGGADASSFEIDDNGQITVGAGTVLDHEAGRSYALTVTAADPQGGSASIAVTVTVTDVDEPPGRPTVSISGQTLSSLSVEWDAPENSGRPAITDYDVEYRRASDSAWTDHPHQGTGLSAVIGPLTPGTDYRVQVMARNEEGDGQWSETAQGTTVASESQDPGDDSTGCEIGAHPTGVRTVTDAWFEPDPSTMTVGVWTEYALTVAGEGCVNVLWDGLGPNTDRLLVDTWFNPVSAEMIEQGFQPRYPPDPESFCRSEETASFETAPVGMGSRVWMIACHSGTATIPIYDYNASDNVEKGPVRTYAITAVDPLPVSGDQDSQSGSIFGLGAYFEGAPPYHDGTAPFTFRIVFSDDIDPYLLHFVYSEGVATGYANLRRGMWVTDGWATKNAKRVDGRNDLWEITVWPDFDGAVTVGLNTSGVCSYGTIYCTEDGRPMSHLAKLTVPGPQDVQVVEEEHDQQQQDREAENSPATGAPSITGTAQVGETLTADTSGIADADGLDDAVFSYQWIAGGSDINGATGSSYTLTEADQGLSIQVWASFTDDAGNAEMLTSAATAAVAARTNNPATGAPSITGTAQVGETLTADTSGIEDADGLDNAAFRYQWLADGADIQGATDSSYTLADSDEGKTITVKVSFTDDAGNGETLTSAATSAVEAAPKPLTAEILEAPSSHDGETAFTFELRFSEEFPIGYEKLRDHVFEVTGGRVTQARRLDNGSNVRWEVTVEPNGDNEVTVVLPVTDDCDAQGAACAEDGRMLSNRTELTVAGPVAEEEKQQQDEPEAENSPATGLLSVTGTAQVGETLTADTSSIADEDGLDNATFSYQWLADSADISGATSSTYTLADSDEGKTITVKVSFSDDAGNGETLTSAATASVEAAVAEEEPTEPPPAPQNLTATVNADGSVTLTWEAPDDDSVTGYLILRRRPHEGEETLLVYVENTGSTATTFTDTDVTAGTQHVYRVKAINDAGAGEQSNYVNVDP